MNTLIARIEWNAQQRKWLMFDDATGFFIYDYWDCESFHRMFPGASKDTPTRFTITTELTPG